MSENKISKSIGAILKEARLSKTVDLEAASKATKIHARILAAMENDDFESLGSVYAKGFLKLYAEYLGLDKEALVKKAAAAGGPKDAGGVKKNKAVSFAGGAPARSEKIGARSRPDEEGRTSTPGGAQHAKAASPFVVPELVATGRPRAVSFQAVAISVAFFVVFVFGVKWMSSRGRVRPAVSKKDAVVKKETKKSQPRVREAQQAVKTAAAKPAGKKSPAPPQAPLETGHRRRPADVVGNLPLTGQVSAAKPLEIPKSLPSPTSIDQASPPTVETKLVLVVRAKNKTWLQLKADGKIVFQTILPKGASESWQAKDKLELWIGDAGSLELEFNGRLLGKIGRPGQTLRHVVLTKNGLSIQR